jgi:hypothetical protein
MSDDKKTFVQWYCNNTEYHRGQNQVVDPSLMDEKFYREIQFLSEMSIKCPELVPTILEIDESTRKIYLEVDGVDFWQRQLDSVPIPDNWQDQMINIIQAHHDLGWFKYSMHPSSYFIVNNQLKSINYFFTYKNDEGPISISAHQSHLSDSRKSTLRKQAQAAGLDWDTKYPLDVLEQLCWESFRDMYPVEFIERAKCIK